MYFFNWLIFFIICLTEIKLLNSIGDTCTPQPGEIEFNTMTYRRSETVQRSENVRANTVNYVKVQSVLVEKTLFKRENIKIKP